jgi:hypothetical protein
LTMGMTCSGVQSGTGSYGEESWEGVGRTIGIIRQKHMNRFGFYFWLVFALSKSFRINHEYLMTNE